MNEEETEKVVCNDCGRVIDGDPAHRDASGSPICRECFDRYYRACANCGKYFRKNNMKCVGGEWYCSSCGDGLIECYDCGAAVHHTDTYIDIDGHNICQDCIADHYHRCNSCGEWVLDDNLEWDGDVCYCSGCYQARQGNEYVMDYHDFDRSAYRPRWVDAKDETICFGVELEVDGQDSFDGSVFTDWTTDGNLIHFEHDGSLDDGVECITMPCTLRFHQERMDWAGICKRFINQGFKSHDTTTCGLHVHISRDCLTATQIVKMDVFFNRAREFWSQIGRRDTFYSSHFREHKTAKLAKAFQSNTGHVPRWCEYKKIWDCCDDRYVALNTTSRRTVEVRFCKGTLNAETILGTVELFHAVTRFVDTIPMTRIYDTNDNIFKFIKFVGDDHEKYPHAFPMMKRLIRRNEEWIGLISKLNAKFQKDNSQNNNNNNTEE